MDFMTIALIGLGTGVINALLATGLVVIYRGSGVINFAQGSFALLSAYMVFEMRTKHGLPLAAALPVAALVTALLGVLVHVLVMRPLRHASPLARVIATLGVLTVVTQAVLLHYGAAQRTLDTPLPSGAVALGGGVLVGRQNLYLVGIALVTAVLLETLTRRSRWGLAVAAAAESPRAASALGWSPDRLAVLTWGLGGLLAALAGALFPATSSGFLSVTQMGPLIIGALATALLAQFRSFWGAALAGVLIGVAQALATRYVNHPGAADAVPFLVIVGVLTVRGKGLPVRGTVADRLPRVGKPLMRVWPLLLTGTVLLVIAHIAVPTSWYPRLIVTFTVAIVGLSVVVVTGYAGQLSLAQFALGGVGAFAGGRLFAAHGWPMEAALAAAVLVSFLVGLVVGLPALKTRGVNLAVVTFGLGFAIFQLLFSNSDYTGGDAQTKILAPRFLGIDVDPIAQPANYASLCLAFLILTLGLVANLRRGRVGRRLLALRTNERAAAALGINVFHGKLYAFAVAASIAGLGGALYGFSYPTILYQQMFPPDTSINALVLTVIGGVGFLAGPVLGALLAPGGAAELLFGDTATATGGFPRYLPLITGVLLITTLLISQHGLAEKLSRVVRPAQTRRRAVTAAPGTGSTQRLASERAPITTKVRPIPLTVTGLSQRFGTYQALDMVDLHISPGEVLGLIGPNGAGKTTVVDTVTGFTSASAGSIHLGDVNITGWSAHRRARAGLARSFQSLELFDDLTVRENLLTAADPRDLAAYATDLVLPRVTGETDTYRAAVEELGLHDVLDLSPESLSYGRRRLVAIARAVAARPSILLLDEPAAGLDAHETRELGHLVRRLADDWGMGVLLIEHDVPLVLAVADRVHVLNFGRTIFTGPPERLHEDDAVRRAYLGVPVPSSA